MVLAEDNGKNLESDAGPVLRVVDGSHQDDYHDRSNHHRHRHEYFPCIGVALKAMLLFTVLGATSLLLLDQSIYSPNFLERSFTLLSQSGLSRGNSSPCENHSNVSSSFHQFMTVNLPSPAKQDTELATILKKASMEDNKTVIITTLNAAWTEPNTIFDLFLESFRIGNGTQNLLKNVVVGAMDQTAYSRCLEKNLHCYALTTDGVDFSGEAYFMTEDYLKLVWRKIDFQRTVLQMGYDFVFTDGDIMWLRDPFPRFYPDGDIQTSCDFYFPDRVDAFPNTGFIYAKSNNRTIQFYKFWYTTKDYFPGKHDQDVFNIVKLNPITQKIGSKIRFLDTAYFGGFCRFGNDLDVTITMHANCCVGMENKTSGLKLVIDDWKKYISSPNSTQRNFTSGFLSISRS